MKLIIHSQISMAVPMMFGNVYVIPSYTYGCNNLPMLGLKLIHVNKGGPWNIPAPAPGGGSFKALFHTFNVYTGVL